MFYLTFDIDIDICFPPLPETKWYNPVDCNNYRKMHHATLRRVVRCRAKARESRGRYAVEGARVMELDEVEEA